MNQAAHGDREHGFIMSRLRLNRKVVVGFWQETVHPGENRRLDSRRRGLGTIGRARSSCRFGDNMREVAVTEGDKVAAQIKFGFSVNGYGVGDLVQCVKDASDKEVDAAVQNTRRLTSSRRICEKAAAGTSRFARRRASNWASRAFLTEGGFKGFTDTFEDLHGLVQLPGVAPQRLMADGVRLCRRRGLENLRAGSCHESHGQSGSRAAPRSWRITRITWNPATSWFSARICSRFVPSIAGGKASLQVHPLGIGGKADPARLVFNTPAGPALNASLMDLGNRFRLLVNEVDVVAPEQPMPKLPVAQAVWKCRPNFQDACAAWIYAGGAHHTGFSQAVTTEMLEDFAAIAGLEVLVIDADTRLRQFKQELAWNDAAYGLKSGWVS